MAGSRARGRYLLGDSRSEAARLRAQARVWDPVSRRLFDRLRLRRGSRVLEVGPGQGSLHLELRRRVRGPVDAVEPSRTFAARLRALCARDGLGPGRLWTTELRAAELPRGHYDVVFARWVFLFLPDVELHLRKLVRALRPGGRLALEEYHRETLVLVPRPSEWTNFLAAERALYATSGLDISLGSRLPRLFRSHGLDVVEIVPHVLTGAPGSPVWRWLSTYFIGMMPRYARFPPFSPTQATRLLHQWRAAERDPAAVMIAPAVLDVVGRKPARPRSRR